MKSIKEVMQITGATRKALRYYDDRNLVKPTVKKTANNFWFYDNEAIQKINTIRIFSEAGYEIKSLKEILEAPPEKYIDELKQLVIRLEEKKKRIEGMINTVDIMIRIRSLVMNQPSYILKALASFDYSKLYSEMSYKEFFNKSIEEPCFSKEEKRVLEVWWEIVFHLIAIASYKEQGPQSKKVQKCILGLYNTISKSSEDETIKKWLKEDDLAADLTNMSFTNEDFVEFVSSELAPILSEFPYKSWVDEGAEDFIREALTYFSVK